MEPQFIFLKDRILNQKGEIVATNSPVEIRDFAFFAGAVSGDVLILGLGLGILPHMMSDKEQISSITVVEISPEIISHWESTPGPKDKINIVQADAWTWEPDRTFDYGIFDIWHIRTVYTWLEMYALRERYADKVRYIYCNFEKEMCRQYWYNKNRGYI